jgi:biopolymer transport protein ExbD
MKQRLFRRSNDSHDMMTLNTTSLPDLIFTVLFFFMIVTHMRDVDLKVQYQVPEGTEIQKLGHKASIVNIYVGKAENGEYAIQLNNQLSTISDIRTFLEQERKRMGSEDLARLTVSLRADRDVPMGIISDIKRELQKQNALRINYSATEKSKDTSKQ